MGLPLECWVGEKTEGEEKIFLFNLFCKDIKGIEEILKPQLAL